MCGITGYIGPSKNLPSIKNIDNCLKAMRLRRGPDSANYKLINKENYSFVFLHSRLSILDPKPRSDQPMEDNDGIISFVGEIFNYLELKELCERRGVFFKTTSDTEVLLKILNIFGEKGISMLDGDWAFSYYNKKQDRIILSKDRFSVKPLFYIHSKDGTYFSSNITHLFLLLGQNKKMNFDKIKNYLSFGFKGTNIKPNTFFHDVIKFPSGNYLEFIKGSKQNFISYWNNRVKIDDSINYKEAVKLVKDAFTNSVKLRLRSDFPIACLLSSGIDSSGIGGISKKIFNKDLNYFSYKPNNKDYDESELIKFNIKSLDAKHKYVTLDTSESISELRGLLKDGAMPLNAPSDYLFHKICQEIKKSNCKVLLSGTAGDDFFAGNYIDHLNYLVSIYKEPTFKKAYKDWEDKIKPLIRSEHLRDFDNYLKKAKTDPIATWHEKEIVSKYLNYDSSEIDQKYLPQYSENFFRNQLCKCIFDEQVPAHLSTNDQIAMYHSIEARFPFLSHKLYEVVNSIPSKFLMQNAVTKTVLRDAIKNVVPSEILNSRNKIGFYMDFNDIFKSNSKEFQDLLFQNVELSKLIQVDKFREILKKEKTNTAEQKLVFNTLNISLMLEEYR